ncbi:10562_t:CDS:2 [Funneliformis caledonium]|uniref:10562_t:CDS:1 n=1 Tax=Funneliformis caledonium TaxID=1117310 RepID=A0A9N9GK30_9GLOM|nr:10562_t:CDS:2 [Funneliformis caledonium]
MSQKKYKNLSEKVKGVEELQEHINQLELMLEHALKNPPFANFFIDKMRHICIIYIATHQEKRKPFTDPEEY